MEIRKLNSLRALAALIVAVSHFYSEILGITHPLGGRAGQLGVMIFFILSGFLMSYLYLGRDFNRGEVRKFAAARFARVIPLFLVVILASFIFDRLGIQGVLYPISSLTSLQEHLLLLFGISVLWTIPTEIHFYLIFVFLWGIFQQNRALLWILMAAICVAVIAADYPIFNGEIFGLNYVFLAPRSLPYFFMGVAFGQLYLNWQPPAALRRHWFIWSLGLILVLYPNVFLSIFGQAHGMWNDPIVLITMALAFFAVVFLVPDNNPIIVNRVGDFYGKISYSLYLLHLPVLSVVERWPLENAWLLFAVFLSATTIVSYISYRFIEEPCRKLLRKRLASRTEIAGLYSLAKQRQEP